MNESDVWEMQQEVVARNVWRVWNVSTPGKG